MRSWLFLFETFNWARLSVGLIKASFPILFFFFYIRAGLWTPGRRQYSQVYRRTRLDLHSYIRVKAYYMTD